MTPPMIPGYGMGNGFELYLQDKMGGSLEEFKQVADKFVAALNERPEIAMAYSAFETNYPQYWVDIDAAKCEQAGVTTAAILETLIVEPYLCACGRRNDTAVPICPAD